MSRLRWLLTAAVAVALVAAGGASSLVSQVPTLLSPPAGATFAAGTRIAFQIRGDVYSTERYLWLHVSRSPAIVETCGVIDDDVELEPFARTADPAVFEARPAFFDFPGFWMNTPGTYYWQVHQIEFAGGADGCLESEVRSFQIVPKAAPAPTPKPAPSPTPKPKAPLPLAKARLQGTFDVKTRVRAATGIDTDAGSIDTGTWGFKPFAKSGPSDVRLTFAYRGASFDRHRLTVRLQRNGASYTGKGTATFLECSLKDVAGPVTFSLRVTKGAWIGGAWRAKRITGTYVHSTRSTTSGIYRCPAAKLKVSLTGSLES